MESFLESSSRSSIGSASGKERGKKYTCEYDGCFKSYTTAGNLKTHIKIHRGERFTNFY